MGSNITNSNVMDYHLCTLICTMNSSKLFATLITQDTPSRWLYLFIVVHATVSGIAQANTTDSSGQPRLY